MSEMVKSIWITINNDSEIMSVRIDEDFSHNEEYKSWSKDVKKKC